LKIKLSDGETYEFSDINYYNLFLDGISKAKKGEI
jgi:hypothetical protein